MEKIDADPVSEEEKEDTVDFTLFDVRGVTIRSGEGGWWDKWSSIFMV